jgi:hypothetical protein
MATDGCRNPADIRHLPTSLAYCAMRMIVPMALAVPDVAAARLVIRGTASRTERESAVSAATTPDRSKNCQSQHSCSPVAQKAKVEMLINDSKK